MGRSRQAVALLLLTLAALAAWRFLLGRTGWAARFGESNYQANLIRIEEYLARPRTPTVVLVGSSVAGRLRPEFFPATPGLDPATLGLDGSTPLVGLEVVARRPGKPALLLVETYLLDRPPNRNDAGLLAALDSPGLALARRDPLFRTASRPSSLLYSWLKSRREEESAGRPAGPAEAAATPAGPRDDRTAAADRHWPAQLRRLQAEGVRVAFVDVPLGESPAPGREAPADTADGLARLLGLPRLDLRAELHRRQVTLRYTDGLHLTAASARQAAEVLSEMVTPLLRAPSPP